MDSQEQLQSSQYQPPKPKFNWKRLLITIAIVLLTATVVGGTVWYFMDQNAKQDKEAADKANQDLQKQIDDLKKAQEKKDTSNTTNITNNSSLPSNIFDVTTVKVGDKIAGMTVTAVSKAIENSPLPYGKENAQISFSGSATLQGTFNYTGDDQPAMITDFITFTADPAFIKYLPIIQGDSRNIFTFSNAAEAKRMFGVTIGKSSSGKATIVINNYKFVIFPGEGSNLANLVSVK